MTNIRLLLLGAPRFEVDGVNVEGVRRKAIALAAFLALTDRPQTRDTLAALFWPDQDEEHGKTSLRSTLHNLNSLSTQEWLEVDRQIVGIQTGQIEIDVQQFLKWVSSTRSHLHSDGRLCDACFEALDSAVNVYQDDFLTGFSLSDSAEFDNWQAAQREWLTRECTIALRRLADHAALSDYDRAISYTHRWLAINPLDEQAHRTIMRLYAANNQRSEALKQYQLVERLLDEELATLPETETIELFETIRDGKTPSVGKAQESRTVDGFPLVSVLPPLPPLVVGREEALTEIKARLGIPNDERRRAVTVIEGWPGVGKSTTIGALAHDPDLLKAFPDGVLWVSLGEHPNVLAKLAIWGYTLHVIAPGKTPTVDTLSTQITSVLRDRQMLLIIDDVWKEKHAAPFRVGGQNCVVVMTSRLNNIARALAPTSSDVYRLPVLSDKYALSLLHRLAPEAVEHHPDESLRLIHSLEGLPLAIQVAGRLLHEESRMGWGVCELLEELQSGSSLLTAHAPGDVQPNANDDEHTAPTITALLKRSTDALDEQALTCFALLSLFSAKPATFDLDALAAAWEIADPKPVVRALVNRGLLEPISGGRFQMHALLVMHAKSLLEGA